MHGLQRCFFFVVLLFYGSVFGRSKRICANHLHPSRNNRNSNRPTRSRRSFPSLLSFLSSVVTESVTSEKTSHVAALHRKLLVDGDDAEDNEADEDSPSSTPVPSISSDKTSSKVDGKRDNVGHNASNKIQVAPSKKKSSSTKAKSDATAVRTPSGSSTPDYNYASLWYS